MTNSTALRIRFLTYQLCKRLELPSAEEVMAVETEVEAAVAEVMAADAAEVVINQVCVLPITNGH